MITRAPRPDSNFYILDKAISGDKRLSWAARGMLVFLLGKPDHWQVSPAALVNETKGSDRCTGRDGVYAILKELKQAGYLQVTGQRDQTGTFAGADYVITESPDVVLCPHTAQPDTAQPRPANPPQVSNDLKQGLKEKQVLKNKTIGQSRVLPDDFKPDETGVALAAKLGVNADTELEAFKDHHAANGSTFSDWQAAFRTWTRNAAKFAQRDRRNSPSGISRPPAESFAERDARNAREAWERMSGRSWPVEDLPSSARPATTLVIDITASQPRRLS
jgi:hypothetical protein